MYTLWISAWPLKHCETGSICRAEKLINAGFNVFKMVGGKNTLVTSWCNSSQFQETVKLTNLSYRIKRGYFLQDLFPSSGLNEVCIPWCHADVTKCYYARTTPRFCARGLKTGLRKAFRLAIFVFEQSYREVVGVHCLRLCLPEHRRTEDRNRTQTRQFYRSCWRKKRIDTVPIAEQKVRNVVRSTANVVFRSHWISTSTLLSCKIYFLIGNYTYVFVF